MAECRSRRRRCFIPERQAALILVVCLCGSCKISQGRPSAAGSTSAALIMTGNILEDAGSVRLWVFDAAVQECSNDGRSVNDPRATTIYATDNVYPDVSGAFNISFEIPEGRRTFYMEVYGDDRHDAIATGCTLQEIAAGSANEVRIWIYPVEAPDADEAADVVEEDPIPEPDPDMAHEDLFEEEETISDIADIETEYSCEAMACETLDWREYHSAGASTLVLHGSISKAITVSDCCFVVEEIKVGVNLLHGYIGDLTVRLERPDGLSFPLHKRRGGSDDNIIGEYPTSLTPAVDLCMLSGGESPGTWSLIVHNNGDFGGTLNGWSLHVKGERETCRDDAWYPPDSFPLFIPDNDAAGVLSSVAVPTDFIVSGVEVFTGITHDNIGDLIITLTSPEGTSCILHNRTGSGTDDILTYYPASTLPFEDLGVFNGDHASGTWSLRVVDFTSVPSTTTGELNGWILYLNM